MLKIFQRTSMTKLNNSPKLNEDLIVRHETIAAAPNWFARLFQKTYVNEGEAAVVVLDGEYHRTLPPGPVYLSKYPKFKQCKISFVNTRDRQLIVSSTDELIIRYPAPTKLDLSVIVTYRVVTPHIVALETVTPLQTLAAFTLETMRQAVQRVEIDDFVSGGKATTRMLDLLRKRELPARLGIEVVDLSIHHIGGYEYTQRLLDNLFLHRFRTESQQFQKFLEGQSEISRQFNAAYEQRDIARLIDLVPEYLALHNPGLFNIIFKDRQPTQELRLQALVEIIRMGIFSPISELPQVSSLDEIKRTLETSPEVLVDEYGHLHIPNDEEVQQQIAEGKSATKVIPSRWYAVDLPVNVPFTISRYIKTTIPQDGQVGQVQALRVQICLASDSDLYPRIHLKVTPRAEKAGAIPIDVYLRFDSADFECDGPNIQYIAVPFDADSEPTIFKVIPKSEGLKTLMIEIYQQNSYIGEISVQTFIGHSVTSMRESSSYTSINTLTQPDGLDLTLRVIDVGLREGKQTYRFELNACQDLNLHFYKGGEISFATVPTMYLEDIRNELNEWANQESSVSLLNERLARIGADLYAQLFPDTLKRLYWESLRERVKTLHIVSDEPWIPWELLKPWRRLPDGDIEEDEFLCERFSLTRWLSGPYRYADLLNLRRLNLLTDASLNYADEELEALRHFPGWAVAVTSLTQLEVYRILQSGGFDGLHFACHGEYNARNPDNSILRLEDGFLRPSDISGRMQRFGDDHPLVFLNACDAAQQGTALTGLGGWAQKFLEARSHAFIGPMWEATSASAKTFAIVFYRFLCEEGKSIAEAVRLAREAIREDGNPTWLSYVVYAHPLARVTPRVPQSQEVQ